MTYEEAISELVVIKSVYSHMRGEYKPCVEALQIAIDLLKRADTPQTDCDKCIWNVCNYNRVDWDADIPQTDLVEDDKCFDCEDFFVCDEHQTDCPWK